MAKKKSTPKKPSLGDDLKDIVIPFDLYTAFSLVVTEMKDQDFTYDSMVKSEQPVVVFNSEEKKEKILVNIAKQNLLIKQFYQKNNAERLKVIYVVKPSERNFNLI